MSTLTRLHESLTRFPAGSDMHAEISRQISLRREADANRALARTAGRSTQSAERAEILRKLGV